MSPPGNLLLPTTLKTPTRLGKTITKKASIQGSLPQGEGLLIITDISKREREEGHRREIFPRHLFPSPARARKKRLNPSQKTILALLLGKEALRGKRPGYLIYIGRQGRPASGAE